MSKETIRTDHVANCEQADTQRVSSIEFLRDINTRYKYYLETECGYTQAIRMTLTEDGLARMPEPMDISISGQSEAISDKKTQEKAEQDLTAHHPIIGLYFRQPVLRELSPEEFYEQFSDREAGCSIGILDIESHQLIPISRSHASFFRAMFDLLTHDYIHGGKLATNPALEKISTAG